MLDRVTLSVAYRLTFGMSNSRYRPMSVAMADCLNKRAFLASITTAYRRASAWREWSEKGFDEICI